MRKKIFYLITKSNWGGAQRYVYDFAIAATKEFDVTVVLGMPRPDTVESGKGVLLKKLSDKGIRTISIPELKRDISFGEECRAFWKILILFWEERPDIIHVNSSKIAGLASFAGRLAGIKRIIFTAHGLPAREPRPGIQKTVISFLTWLTSFFAHRTITITHDDFDTLSRLPFLSKKISYIPNGMTPPARLSREDARKIFENHFKDSQDVLSNKETVWTGTIGELIPNKGHLVTLAALERISTDLNFAHIIIGGGEDEQNLRREIIRRGLEKKVFLAGFIPNASSLLSAFDVFILSSYKEGLPYSILEAGFASVPVIATRTGEIPYLLENGRGIVVEPGNDSELASKLTPLLISEESRKKYANTFLEFAHEEFSFEKAFSRTKTLYEFR